MGSWVPDDQRIIIYHVRYSTIPLIRYSVTGGLVICHRGTQKATVRYELLEYWTDKK